MANKISIILSSILILMILGGVYWFKRGDACLAQPPYYNCHVQDKFAETDESLSRLSDWSLNLEQRIPNVLTIDNNDGMFTFEHVTNGQAAVLTKIIKNGSAANSLGFFSDYVDPVFYLDPELTALTADKLIASVWFQPRDTKLYNGPFTNYLVDFTKQSVKKLDIRGKIIAKSPDGTKVVFIENECVKNPPSLEIDHACNNQNLSLRLLDLSNINDGFFITHYGEIKLLDFNKVVFSPNNKRLAIEAKIESMDYDTKHEYWTLFIANTSNGQIIKQNNSLTDNRHQNVYWLDDENILYW